MNRVMEETMLVKRLDESAELPKYKTVGASGMDVTSIEEVTLKPLERKLVKTGLIIEVPVGYEAQLRARSGLSIKHGITLINGIGTIDSDYRGEVMAPMVNLSNEEYTITKGERIAQLVISKFTSVGTEEVTELTETERGEGGFGSTDK